MNKPGVQRAFLLLASCVLALGGCVSAPHQNSHHGQADGYPRDDRSVGERRERGDAGELGRLAHELDTRAREIVERSAMTSSRANEELFGRLRHFSDRARQFHGQVEDGQLFGGNLDAALLHLRDDARETDRSVQRAQVSHEMLEEWQGITRILDRMLTLVEG